MVLPFVWEILDLVQDQPRGVVASRRRSLPQDPTTCMGIRAFFGSVPFWAQFSVSAISLLILRSPGRCWSRRSPATPSRGCGSRAGTCSFALFLLMLMVPSQLFLLGQFEIDEGTASCSNTLPALAIPGIFSAFGTFLMRQAFMAMPKEYEEAARIDGAGTLRVFWSVDAADGEAR